MTPWLDDGDVRLYHGDALTVLAGLPAGSVQTVVTSPPYWGLRDYGASGQLGLDASPGEYVAALIGVFREVRRVLRDDGTVWLNLGDSYAGSASQGGPSEKQQSNAGSWHDAARRTQQLSLLASPAIAASGGTRDGGHVVSGS